MMEIIPSVVTIPYRIVADHRCASAVGYAGEGPD